MTSNAQRSESSIPALTLFVTGQAPRSERARRNLARMLTRIGLTDLQTLEIDLLEQPDQGVSHSIFATPSLLKTNASGEVSVLYGDLSEEDRLYHFLADLAPDA